MRQGVEGRAAGSVLVVGLKDEAVKLLGGRKQAVYRIRKTATSSSSSGTPRSTRSVASTKTKHKQMVQYHADWDFLLSRAEACGLLTVVEDGAVSLKKMALSGAAKRRVDTVWTSCMTSTSGRCSAQTRRSRASPGSRKAGPDPSLHGGQRPA